MVEEGDKRVSTNVLELARKLNIDPELAQEVYFASNLSEALDGLDKNYFQVTHKQLCIFSCVFTNVSIPCQ